MIDNQSESLGKVEQRTRVRAMKAGSAIVVVNSAALAVAIQSSGLTRKTLAQRACVSYRTLSNWLDGKVANREALERVCSKLNIAVQAVIDESHAEVSSGDERTPAMSPALGDHIRNLSGRWAMTGVDVPVAGHFDLTCDPKQSSGYIDITMRGRQVFGIGADHDDDRITLEGKIFGDYVQAMYSVDNPRTTLICGVCFLHYHASGRHLEGHALQKHTGQETRLGTILHYIRLDFVSELSSSTKPN